MPLDSLGEFTLEISLPKCSGSAETRRLYKNKLQSWLSEEKKTMPFEKMQCTRTQIALMSKDVLFVANFKKKISVTFGAKKPMQNLDKLNEVGNRICSYLNTIMPQEVKEAKVSSSLSIVEKEKIDFARRIIGDSRIAKVSEVLKISWNPLAILFTWKSGMRENFALCGGGEGLGSIQATFSHFEWEKNLPLDAVLTEKREFLKLREMVTNILKEEM